LFDEGQADVHGELDLSEGVDAVVDAMEGAWGSVLQRWRRSASAASLLAFLRARQSAGASIYPPRPLRALELTPLETVRVVILGQDPYHGPGQADGLAFSVPPHIKAPPSLRNIFKEYARALGGCSSSPDLIAQWAGGGVLLLNSTLTVERGMPASHADKGWETLTDALLTAVAERPTPTVFLLWGAHAQSKSGLIERVAPSRHHLLLANHPSPLSALRKPRPFIGCGHFAETQRLLPGFLWSPAPNGTLNACVGALLGADRVG
jgi:uracil-DNA glycosylase